MGMHLYIHGGQVIDGTGAAPFAASVLVRDDKIVAVGQEADQQVMHLDQVKRIDASGLTVMPGLIDSHCHLSFDDASSNLEIFHQRRNALSALVASYNAKKVLRAGVTSILDPDSVFANSIDLRDAINAGYVEGPRMACGAYALITGVGGTAGHLIADEGVTGYYRVVHGENEIIKEVRRQIKEGVDWIKVHVSGVVPHYAHLGERCSWSQKELDLVCEVAHDMGVPVMGHCRGAEAVKRSVKADFDMLFHATGMDEEAIQMVIDKRIPVCPSLTFQANIADFGTQIGTSQALIDLFKNEIQESVEPMKRLIAAGIPLICGSESGFTAVPYGDWHHREMEVFVNHFGMTPLQALRSATADNAFAMKMSGELGLIKPGCFADILCIEGDPSQQISLLGETRLIQHVIKNGQSLDLSPLPAHKRLSGWHIPSMGQRISKNAVMPAFN